MTDSHAPLPPELAGTVVEEKRARAMRLLAPTINKKLGEPNSSYQYTVSFELWHISCGDDNEVDAEDLKLVAEEYRKIGWMCHVGTSERDGMWINFYNPKHNPRR